MAPGHNTGYFIYILPNDTCHLCHMLFMPYVTYATCHLRHMSDAQVLHHLCVTDVYDGTTLGGGGCCNYRNW